MPKPKILVVDDDPDLLRALRLRLRANNYDVATASDGYAAIASAQKERPSLIILDLGLPVGDGFVVLDRLQNSDSPFRDSGNRAERPRSAEQRRKSPQGRRRGIFPEARRQRRTDERNPGQPRAGSRKVRGLAVLTGQGQELDRRDR